MKIHYARLLITFLFALMINVKYGYTESADELFEKGLNFAREGDARQALWTFEEVIKIDSNHAEAYNEIGILYYNWAVEQRNASLLHESIRMFQKALEINPEMGDAHDNLASAYLITREVDKALEHYTKAKSLGMENPRLDEFFSTGKNK